MNNHSRHYLVKMAALQHVKMFLKGQVRSQTPSVVRYICSEASAVGNMLCARKGLDAFANRNGRSILSAQYLKSKGFQSCPSAGHSLSTTSSLSFTRTNASSPSGYKPGHKTRSRNQDEAYVNSFDPKLVTNLLKRMDGDMPVLDMPNPFERSYPRCFLCRNDIQLDHKNVRLLSQFVSPYTGRIYGRAVTGLCIPMQRRVAKLIKRARLSGYMPFILKDPKYLNDPQPYDSMARNHKYTQF